MYENNVIIEINISEIIGEIIIMAKAIIEIMAKIIEIMAS
jgi:hypothetical protein